MKSYFWVKHRIIFLSVGFLLLLGGALYFGEWRRQKVLGYQRETNKELQSTRENLENKDKELSADLGALKGQIASLVDLLGTQQNQSTAFQEQLGHIGDTIGTLDSLSKVDPELLQKYSKVFFLNEHYTPKSLANVDSQFTYDKSRQLQFLADAGPFLEKLLLAGQSAGLKLYVESSYRSFGTQASLKARYKVTYGAGTANSFSADQGYSEHQLGTTVDFTTDTLKGELEGFDKTAESAWLTANAHQYGFVLSYPENNKYYVYEPWHWRFVGVDLATRLHREGKYFYDFDQRQINSYLAVLFN